MVQKKKYERECKKEHYRSKYGREKERRWRIQKGRLPKQVWIREKEKKNAKRKITKASIDEERKEYECNKERSSKQIYNQASLGLKSKRKKNYNIRRLRKQIWIYKRTKMKNVKRKINKASMDEECKERKEDE